MTKSKRKTQELAEARPTAMYIAKVIRDAMEAFATANLIDPQTAELNSIIRNAIYTALYAMEQAKAGSAADRVYVSFQSNWPDYWQLPELLEDYTKTIAMLNKSTDLGAVLKSRGGK